jgi:hypothetical protein
MVLWAICLSFCSNRSSIGGKTGMAMGEDFFLSSSWRSMWNKRGLGECSALLLISMSLGVPGSAMVDSGVRSPKEFGIPIVFGVLRTAAMSAKLQS